MPFTSLLYSHVKWIVVTLSRAVAGWDMYMHAAPDNGSCMSSYTEYRLSSNEVDWSGSFLVCRVFGSHGTCLHVCAVNATSDPPYLAPLAALSLKLPL